jgi:hypothetical protein
MGAVIGAFELSDSIHVERVKESPHPQLISGTNGKGKEREQMDTVQGEITLERLVAKVAELEQEHAELRRENARIGEELATLMLNQAAFFDSWFLVGG